VTDEGDELRVLSWRGRWGEALRRAVSEPFSRATGIRVCHVGHVGLSLPPHVVAAAEAASEPAVDVVWSNTIPAMDMAARGLCERIAPEELSCSGGLRQRATDGQEGPLDFVRAYVVYYVLTYVDGCLPRNRPISWSVLTDRRFSGKVALYPGGNGFYPIAQVMAGGQIDDIPADMTPCWSFVEQVARNIGALDYSIGMEQSLRSGRLSLCFRALANALGFRAAGVPVSWCVPREGTSSTTDALWMPRGVEKKRRAKAVRYIDYALSPAVQTRWCELLGAVPVHREARAPALIREQSALPDDADCLAGVLHLPEQVIQRYRGGWEQQFDAIAERARAEA
jgi:putative spermidine/putrescine transport system substrate-binding protein